MDADGIFTRKWKITHRDEYTRIADIHTIFRKEGDVCFDKEVILLHSHHLIIPDWDENLIED
jgi:hypothetical protein